MQIRVEKLLSYVAFVSVIVIVVGSILTSFVYTGEAGEAYSMLNHYISELGELSQSEWAPIFNSSLIIGGIGLTFFMILLGINLRHWFAWIASAVGVYAGINCTLVGFIPMDTIQPHYKVAMDFFFYGMISVGLYSMYFLFFSRGKHPKFLAIPGMIAAASFASFLYLPSSTLQPIPAADRPPFLLITFLEWMIFITVLIWVVVVASYFLKKSSINQK
jgi:hypothetical protein